jgi:choline transport protein
VLNYPDYVFQRWHGTLLVFAVSAFSVFFNSYLAKKLPLIEGIVLFVHIVGFLAVLVTFWVLGPRGNAHDVFFQFNNLGGWNSYATSTLVGTVAAVLPLLGADAAVHMSEELKDAAKVLPMSMIWTTVFNGALGLAMAITFCFCLGNLDDAINTPTGYAFIEVFYVTTKSHIGATLLSSLIIFMTIFINLSIVATASRQLFAFARDKGLPFGRWIAYVCSSLLSFQVYDQCEITAILFSRNQVNKAHRCRPERPSLSMQSWYPSSSPAC